MHVAPDALLGGDVRIHVAVTVEEGGIEVARRLAARYYEPERAAQTLKQWEQIADRLVVLVITPRRIRSSVPE